MSDTVTLPAEPEVANLLEPSSVLPAISDPVRHALLCALADGTPRSVNDLAARFKRSPDGISKHLRVLRDARLIRAVTPPGSDGRKQFHELPALFRSRDSAGKTVLDFGAVLVRVA
jgi:DNA-binding transcriptional ArsR family regulator